MSPLTRAPRLALGAALGAGAAAAAAALALAASPSVPTRIDLVSANAVGAGGRQLALTAVKIPAHSFLPKHRHPGTEVATVLAGKYSWIEP
jgi:quercetin dioxygenase-like cupin family protein